MSMVFCRTCGKELHQTALACPSCSAPQDKTKQMGNATYSSYSQVPWFRKSWFIVVGFLVFAPITLYSLFSGNIYYEKKGQLVTYSKIVKIITIILCLMSSVWWVGKMLGAK